MSRLSKATRETSNQFGRFTAKLCASCAIAVLAFAGATSASAVPVTYTIQADAMGSVSNELGPTLFNGAVTITAIGDTSDTVQDWLHTDVWTTGMLSVTFDIAGLGSYAGNPSFYGIATRGAQLEFASLAADGSMTLMELQAADGIGYALQSNASAGPLGYDIDTFAGTFQTALGTIAFNSLSNITFQAEVADVEAVPEPGSIQLIAGAGLALVATARRRRKALLAR